MVKLLHGDCDYLIAKELKAVRKHAMDESSTVIEIFGAKSLEFSTIENTLASSDLFMSKNLIIIRDLMDSRSFFPFIEPLVEFLQKKSSELQNDLILIHSGKIAKTSRLYKTLSSIGEVKEFEQPKSPEILDMIQKSIKIKSDASRLLVEYSNSNLFTIKNEIEKLKNFALTKQENYTVTSEDVELLCIKSLVMNDVWGIGGKYLSYVIQSDAKQKFQLQASLMKEVRLLYQQEVASMQILYSWYQYVIAGIKLRMGIDAAKIKSEREAYAFGYFFAKEFYSKQKQLTLPVLQKSLNDLLQIEYALKSGDLPEELALKKLLLM